MAVYIPNISDYAPFYIQRAGDAAAVNVQTAFGVTVLRHEYPMDRQVKQPYKNDWKDRSGADEWNNVLYYEPIEITTECIILSRGTDSATERASLAAAVRTFQNAIANGEFKIFDDWTKFGYQKCRVESFSKGEFDSWNARSRVIFTMKLKVNDPMTVMKMQGGSIVQA